MSGSDEEHRESVNDECRRRAEERRKSISKLNLTPQEIAERLRYWVIGQDEAVETVSIMLYQHLLTRVWRVLAGFPEIAPVRIPPILLIGGTGCGKTTLMRALSRISELPFVHCDATMATETGWQGETPSAEWLRNALHAADMDRRLASVSILMIDELDKKVATYGHNRDISGAGAQDGMLRLLEGGRHTVEVSEFGGAKCAISMDSSTLMIVCAGAFAGLDDIIRRRLRGSRQLGFGAVRRAEVSDMSSEDLLRQVRPEDLIAYGLKPELVGRLANVVVIPALSDEAMRRIAADAPDGPVNTLQTIAKAMGFNLHFPPALVDLIVERAMESGLGARGMHLWAARASRRAFLEVPGVIKSMGRKFISGYTHVQLRSDSLTNGYYAIRHEIPGTHVGDDETVSEAPAPRQT